MSVDEKKLNDKLREVIYAAIYHGRHFSSRQDEVVIRKSIAYLKEIIGGARE